MLRLAICACMCVCFGGSHVGSSDGLSRRDRVQGVFRQDQTLTNILNVR